MSAFEWRRDRNRILLDLLILRPDPPSDLTSIGARALLDTGASTSGIAGSVARRLGLLSVGKRPVVTAGGTILVDRYLFRIGFPIDGTLPFVFDEIAGFELIESTAFDAVLGMDVLARCDFTMRRDGRCILDLG